MSIEGEWKGVYRYGGSSPGDQECSFTADLTFVVWEITGTITDLRDVVSVIPFQSSFDADKGSMTPRQLRRAEKFLRRYPDAALRVELPVEAEVYGDRLRSRIRFEKSYKGLHKTSWILGCGEVVVSETAHHKVWYEGRLSSDEAIIEGTWKVRRPGFFGRWFKPLNSGSFRMERKQGDS